MSTGLQVWPFRRRHAGRGTGSARPTGRRAWLAARLLLATTLFGAGVVLGWWAGADRDLVEAEPAPAEPGPSQVATAGTGAPDVRGLALVDARQVIVDSGIRASLVAVRERPAAGPEGIVVAQDPAFGFEVDTAMTLFVSTPAVVPAFDGRDADEVLGELDGLGAELATVSRFSPGVPVGHIVSIRPRPGKVIGGPVTVILSAAADEVPLSSVESASSSCYAEVDGSGEEVGSMNGTGYTDLFTCSSGAEPQADEWVLRRAVVRLTGDLGIPDTDGQPGESVRVVVRGDGRDLGTFTATYGAVTPIDLDVTGVLRLSISYVATGAARSDTYDSTTLGMGRMTLEGDAQELAALVGAQP